MYSSKQKPSIPTEIFIPPSRKFDSVPLLHSDSLSSTDSVDSDVVNFLQKRHMTPAQERFNALTMLPALFICAYELWHDDQKSFPVLAVATAFFIHVPASIIYHAVYATKLDCVVARTHHWSRKLDHAMIHAACLIIGCAFGSFGEFKDDVYKLVLNIIYLAFVMEWNLHAIYRHALVDTKINTALNQKCVLIGTLLYTIPLYTHFDTPDRFLQAWACLITGFALFKWYPLGGWSHGLFHIALIPIPYILIKAAIELSARDNGASDIAVETCSAMDGNTSSMLY